MKRIMLAVGVLLLLAGGGVGLIATADDGAATIVPANNDHEKVFVCKYKDTPGGGEELQTGQNPISVDYHPGREPGGYFEDAQGRSYSLAYDVGQPEPPVTDCPPPNPGTTTTSTSSSTTSTSSSTTSTTVNPCPDPPCTPGTVNVTTTTSTTIPGTTTTSSTIPGATTTTSSTLPPITTTAQVFQFGAAATVCVREVPTIRINFLNTFPELAGRTGTLTMTAVNGGAVVSTQPLVYQPGTSVDLLYPGTRVNPDGSIADVPGWNLTNAGLWVRDPADAYLRDGIILTYTVNPTATASVTYPPESATCSNPENPTTPTTTPVTIPATK